MARTVHVSTRSRYRLVSLCLAGALVYYLCSPHSTGLVPVPVPISVQWQTGATTDEKRPKGATQQQQQQQQLPPLPPLDQQDPKVRLAMSKTINNNRVQVPEESLEHDFFSWKGPDYVPGPKPPYKPARTKGPPVPDPFPLLSSNDINKPNKLAQLLRGSRASGSAPRHYPEATPLLIGFTRNWPQLLQCVVSYIAAGWPPSDIFVVENTGVMNANREGKLTLQNPFHLNHTQLQMLGVNVLVTPTLLTFAQLQNFYAWTALERDWTDFFWSHQDIVVFSMESQPGEASYTLYDRAVGVLQYLQQPGTPKWANHFFDYDHLTLVHRDAVLDVGGWDTHIPFYATDCDMYVRLMWAGYWQGETQIGIILDVATVLDDVGALLRIPGSWASFAGDPGPPRPPVGPESKQKRFKAKGAKTAEEEEEEARKRREVDRHGETLEHLVEVARRMEEAKYAGGSNGWRNQWQLRQSGGEGEPFWRDPDGFETGLRMMIDTGRAIFAEKWGHRGCDIAKMNIKAEDAWRLERDWDPATDGAGYEGDDW